MVFRTPDLLIRLINAVNQRHERYIVLERDHRHRGRAGERTEAKVRVCTVPLAPGVVPVGEAVNVIFLQDLHDAIREEAVAND